MTLVEELRNKQSRDNRDLLDRAAEEIDRLEAALRCISIRKGKWERSNAPIPYYDYTCSVCGCGEYRHLDRQGKVRIMNYCPNCGSKMEVASDE